MLYFYTVLLIISLFIIIDLLGSLLSFYQYKKEVKPKSLPSIFKCSCKRSYHKHWCLSAPLFLFYYRVASGAGLRRPSVRPSHIQFTMWLPMALRTSVSSRGKSSRSSERTLDRWVPRFLWIPEHSMHMRAPRFRLAHVGSGEERKGVPTFGMTALILWLVPPTGDQFAKWKDQITEVTIG